MTFLSGDAEEHAHTPRDFYAIFAGPSEMSALCRDFDWSASTLGPVAQWPQSLQTIVSTVLASAFPMIVLWGQDLIQIYNDAYIPLLGTKHPWGLGTPTRECWPEVWHFNEPIYERVMRGETVFFEDQLYTIARAGPDAPLDDVYITLSYSPVRAENGTVGGVLVTLIETTSRVISKRLEVERDQLYRRLDTEAEMARSSAATIVEAVTDGFVASDRGLRYTYVNARAAEMWGLPPSALLGKTPQEVWPEMQHSLFVAMFKRVLASGVPEIMEGYASSLRMSIEVRAYPSSEGGLVTFFTDITERLRRQETVAFMADASRMLASSSDFQTTLTNLARTTVPRLGDWCAVDVLVEPDNPEWPPMIERVAVVHRDPAKLALAQTITTEFPQDWSRDTGIPVVLRTQQPMFVPDVSDAMLVAGAQNEAHLAMLRELHFRSLIIVPLVARNRVLGTVALVMSDSERHFTKADLALALDLGQRAGVALDNARLLRTAQDANASKSRFLANMSHELRQPLNAITGYADLITMGVRGPVTDQQREDLERIKSSSTHLTSLIGDILQFATIEAGQLGYNLVRIPVNATLREVASFIEPQVRAKHLTFEFEHCDPDLAVRADRDRFIQAVLNLLTNATKYTPEGGTITLSCATTGSDSGPEDSDASGHDTVVLRVADTGIGIPRHKQPTIFEPFVQAHRSLNRPTEGVGLGLAIARDIARHMGGDLTVASEEGAGSTFILTLPRA